MIVENILISLIIGLVYFLFLKKDIHIFQLEEYKTMNFFKWVNRNRRVYIQYFLIGIVTLIIVRINIHTINSNILLYIIGICIIALQMFQINKQNQAPLKKEIKYTARVIRIITITVIIFIIEILIALLFETVIYILLSILGIMSIINIILANILLIPIQKLINLRYILSAKNIISKRDDLIVIGITGSYGKTSTKFILETILSEKYNVLATPNSYNTTLGNVRTVREKLTDEHQILISEMGARRTGDIKEICDIVRPKYGIITSIGKQHLETFKNIDNIVKGKYEIIDNLPEDGVAFFPADNEYTYELYLEEERKKYLYGFENEDIKLDLAVKDIRVSEAGSTFILFNNNESIECTTQLLGEHNALNILGCAAIALELGLSFEEIKIGISKIEPIEHRLQIMPNNNGTIVLDDSFNSNPNGTKVALKVLSGFTGRKIIITPRYDRIR